VVRLRRCGLILRLNILLANAAALKGKEDYHAALNDYGTAII
jgi:hypothetical protein